METYQHILQSIEDEDRAAFVFSEDGDLQICNNAADKMLKHLDSGERKTISGHLEKQCKTHLILGNIAEKAGLDLFLPNSKGEYVCHKLSLLAIRYQAVTAYVAIFSDLPFSTGEGLRFSDEVVSCYDPLEHANSQEEQLVFTKMLPLRIRRAKDKKQRLALILIRLTSHHSLKYTFSQDLQHQLLSSVRGKLKASLGEDLEISQLSDERFLLFKELKDDCQELSEILGSLDRTLLAPAGHDDEISFLAVNAGAAEYPKDGRDSVSLLDAIDIAFAVSENLGKNRYVVFTASMQEAYERRVIVANRLADAVSNSDFELRFQPIVSVADKRHLGYEVNIYWKDSVLGVVALDEFMAAAEDTGLILALYDWLFERLFTLLSAGQVNGVQFGKLTVPVSAILFRGDYLLRLLKKNILKEELQHGSLVLELSERLLLEDSKRILPALAEIREIGIELSLKNFGEEHSPLQCIHRYPLDYVKIAPSLVQKINDNHTDTMLCPAIIQLAHHFKLPVIAQGVASSSQRDFLNTIHCDFAQGDLFSEPIAEEQLADYRKDFSKDSSQGREQCADHFSSGSFLNQLKVNFSRLLNRNKKNNQDG